MREDYDNEQGFRIINSRTTIDSISSYLRRPFQQAPIHRRRISPSISISLLNVPIPTRRTNCSNRQNNSTSTNNFHPLQIDVASNTKFILSTKEIYNHSIQTIASQYPSIRHGHDTNTRNNGHWRTPSSIHPKQTNHLHRSIYGLHSLYRIGSFKTWSMLWEHVSTLSVWV